MIVAISVVMAVYNGRRFLDAQIQSVLADIEPGDELVVVDDASSDGSYELLMQFDDERIVLRRNEVNQGVRCTFERALLESRHDIIFLCDQDDLWIPGKRAAFVAEFERDPAVLVVISDAEIIDAEDRTIGGSFMATRGGFHGGVLSTLVRNRYLGCAMALRRKLVVAGLPIPPRVPMHDMWFGALGALLGRVRYIPKCLLRYRRHGANLSPSRRQGWLQMMRWRMALSSAVARRAAALLLQRR